jgi:C_GCAxxG_C_C family probable redox protein
MSQRSDVAVNKLLAGYNCAQAVIYSFCDDLGLDRNTALKLSCGLGGGMARKQEVCGAVTGGILALGLSHGRGEGQDKDLTEKTYNDVRELISLFEAASASPCCRAATSTPRRVS